MAGWLCLALLSPNLFLLQTFKGELRDIGSSAAMKGYWIGTARQYFLFNFRQNTVAG